MTLFAVWDELNQTEKTAWLVEATDASDAAEEFAEHDSDGMSDGLYTNNYRELHNVARDGHPVSTRNRDTGELRRFRVGVVEFQAVFGSSEVEEIGHE